MITTALWHALPGPWFFKLLVFLLIAAVVVYALFYFVFPLISPLVTPQEVTVE